MLGHASNVPKPLQPSLGYLVSHCVKVSPQMPSHPRGDVLLPLLFVSYPQYGANAPMMEGIEPVQLFAQGGPAFTPIQEDGQYA